MKWCIEHGRRKGTSQTAATRYIDDRTTPMSVEVTQIAGVTVLTITNYIEGQPPFVVTRSIEENETFFLNVRLRKDWEL